MALTLLLTTACGIFFAQTPSQKGQLSSAACQVIQHDVGKTTVCSQPQRIAVLGPYMLDLLLALERQPIGFAEFSTNNIGEPIQKIPVLGDRVTSQPINLGLRDTPSLETLLKLKPDLILGEAYMEQFYPQFSQIAPTLLFEGTDKDTWQRGIQGVAQALGREAKAKQVIKAYHQKLAATRTALAPVRATHPRLLLLTATMLPSSFNVTDSRHFMGGIIEDLGFQLVIPDEQQLSDHLSLEVLPQLKADIIIASISDHLRDDAMEHIKRVWNGNPITQSLRATREGQVYFVDAYLWASNIRGAIAAETILDRLPKLLLPRQETGGSSP